MSLGAKPLDASGVRAIFDRKMADFRHVASELRVRHLRLDPYFGTAQSDPDVRFAIESGFIGDLQGELRDPVLVSVEERAIYTCPPLAVRVLSGEPPEIHRAFAEGVFMRKLFRFFVPATVVGGPPWEAVEQVREIMQRHFAWQLVVTETLLGPAA